MKNINENKQNNIEIINISDYFIKINLNNPEIREFKIIKSERSSFKKDDNIVKYILKGKNDINYVKSPIYGWIEKYDENDKTLNVNIKKQNKMKNLSNHMDLLKIISIYQKKRPNL